MDPHKQRRRGAPKSRQGCSRCKARRVKCDEVHPSCGNCTRIGYHCPGFQQQLKWSSKHERTSTTTTNIGVGARDDFQSVNAPSDATSDVLFSLDVYGRVSCEHLASTRIPCSRPGASSSLPSEIRHNLAPDVHKGIYTSARNSLSIASEHRREPLIRQPTDLSTTLVEYWFRSICPMRSTFDSPVNYNRLLAHGTWDWSESAFLTLKAMSAACLAGQVPEIRQMLPSLSTRAVAVVQKELRQVRSGEMSTITVDLLFATFTLGSSLHWIYTDFAEHEWLECARQLLSQWETTITPMYAMLQAHFRQASTYWQMCAAATRHDSVAPRMDQTHRQHRDSTAQPLYNEDINDRSTEWLSDFNSTPWSTRPNSWGGVSEEVIDYFGQVLSLCRRAKYRSRLALSNRSMEDDPSDLAMAHELQQKLLSLDVNAIVLIEESQGFLVQTEDTKTPIWHLTQTAEAYRLASLLQLHMAFERLPIVYPDSLTPQFAPSHVQWEGNAGAQSSRQGFLRDLAMQLLAILKAIPVDSGSSSIHNILYISAATALTLEKVDDITSHLTDSAESPTSLPTMANGANTQVTESFTRNARIQESRDFVIDRLRSLQKMLPHQASGRTLRLVRMLWSEYDARRAPVINWIDLVMERGWEGMLR